MIDNFPKYFTANFVAWALSNNLISLVDLQRFKWYSVWRNPASKIQYRLNGAPKILNYPDMKQVTSLRNLVSRSDEILAKKPFLRLDFDIHTGDFDARHSVYTNVTQWRHCTEGDSAVREYMKEYYHLYKPRGIT